MHPNLTKSCPARTNEPQLRINIAQATIVLGTWAALFAAGYALLP
ncbi:hypothetical protein [Poseidonocella sp. HB161398]|nr:hypothetical protein [Poseidonocella sp. HB161398]